MLEVSFQDEVGPFEGTLDLSPTPADQTAIALAGEDTLDDICSQIRMFRSTISDYKVAKDWPRDAVTFAASPERSATFGWNLSGTTYSPASLTRPNWSQQALSTTSTSCTAHGLTPSRQPVLRVEKMKSVSFADVERHRRELASQDPLIDATTSLSPVRVTNTTMWEERQLESCFRRWSSWRSAALSSPSLIDACPELSPRDSPILPEANFRRRDLCFRIWHRICAQRTAEEFSISLKLLDAQVSKQLRRGLARWWTWSQANRGRKVVLKHQATLRRLGLKRWRSKAALSVQRRVARDQVCALLRTWFLRHSARLWAARAKKIKRLRRHNHCCDVKRVRWTFAAWQRLKSCNEMFVVQATENAKTMLEKTKRSTLRQWLEKSRQNQQRRLLVLLSRRNLFDRQRRDVLRTFSKVVAEKRGLTRSHKFAKQRLRHRCQSAVFLAWARWSYKGLQLRRIYQGHRATRVRNEMQPVFDNWISMVRREQRQNAALQRATIVMALSLKRRSFHCWHTMLHARRKGMAVLLALAATPLSLFFNCWSQAVAMLKKERELILIADRQRAQTIKARVLRHFLLGSAANRLELEQETIADSTARRRLYAACFLQWRAGSSMARVEREQLAHATKRHTSVLEIRAFSSWRSNAAEYRWEREHHAVADSRQQIRFMRLAWNAWCRFSAFKRHKRHEPKAKRCMELGRALRRRYHLQAWAQAFRSAQRHRHNAHVRNLGALRAFFGWGTLARQRKELVDGLLDAHNHSRRTKCFQSIWSAWMDFASQAMVETNQKMSVANIHHSQGLLYIGFWAFHENLLQNVVERRKIMRLTDSLQVLIQWEQYQAAQWSIGTWWDWVEQERQLDEAELELANLELRLACFEKWASYCERVGHKRMVHEVCDQHRLGRLLLRTFEGWRSTQLHLADVTEAVHQWVDGLEIQRGFELFEVWQKWAMHRRLCRTAAAKVTSQRQSRVVSTWIGSLRKQQTTWLVMQRAFQNQRLACFRSWHERAKFQAVRARRNNVLTEAVHSSRRRRWVEQWVEAARWKRLGQVATSWDQQSFSRRSLIAVLHAWSATTALLALGPKLEQQIAMLRAQAHMRCWGKLSRMLNVYRQALGRQAISQWDKFIRWRKNRVRAIENFRWRKLQIRAEGCLKTWDRFRHTHKAQSQHMRKSFGDVERWLKGTQRMRYWQSWNKWSQPRRRVRQAVKDGHMRDLKTPEAKGLMVQTQSRKRIFSSWHEAWRGRGSHKGSFDSAKERVHQPQLPEFKPYQAPTKNPALQIKISQPQHVQASSCLPMNPFCICEIKSSQPGHFQKRISDTTSPIWNEAFELDNYKVGEDLSFKMMNKDYIWPKPDVALGSAVLECDAFYPFGFRGDVPLLADGKQAGTIRVQIDVFNAPHLKIRRLIPTVARVIVPINQGTAFTSWKRHFYRLKEVAKSAGIVHSRSERKRRTRVFQMWYDVFDHRQAACLVTRMLNRVRASRMFREWAKFAGFHKKFAAHMDHMERLKKTTCVQACFKRWYESMQAHYEVAMMWLNRWRHWSSALLLAWRGYVRDRQWMRRNLRDLQRGAKHLQKCRKADFLNLCRLSRVLRACFGAYVEWSRKESLIRSRSAQLQERVGDARQRRRLLCWVACSRSAGQENEEIKLATLRNLLPPWVHNYARQPPPVAIGKPELADERHAAYVQGIVFALWAEHTCSMRPMRYASRSLKVRVQTKRKAQGLAMWRHWTQIRCLHSRVVAGHRHRWGGLTLWPCLVAWRRTVRISRALASVHYITQLRLMTVVWSCWQSQRSRSKKSYRVAAALSTVQESQVLREVLWSWAGCASRDTKVRRLVRNFDAAHSRWNSEDQWRHRASVDPTLQAMFSRFASAFDGHRAESLVCFPRSRDSSAANVPSLPRASGFDTVLSLIWSRQQLTVALARLKGHRQAWMLNMWPLNLSPMLLPSSDDYRQVERRFPIMVSRLEEESSVAYATTIVRASKQKRRQPVHTGSMWLALADLLVIHYPGWPSQSRQPVAQLTSHPERERREHRHEHIEAFPSSSLPPDATPHFGACRSVEPRVVSTSCISFAPLPHGNAVMAVSC